MTRPIAKPANVPARTRRRQRSPSLLRPALIVALAIACVFAFPSVLQAVRSAGGPVVGSKGNPPGMVAGQVAMSGLQAGACMSFSSKTGSGKTVFIDPGHGGPDPGVGGTVGPQQGLGQDLTPAGCLPPCRFLPGAG